MHFLFLQSEYREKKKQDNSSGINTKSSVRIIQYVKHHIENILKLHMS